MKHLLLFCAATLATKNVDWEQELASLTFTQQVLLIEVGRPAAVSDKVLIAYKVLEVFPRGRRVQITCHAPKVSPPVTYTLFGSQNVAVAKKTVNAREPADFRINVTLKSRPDLLTYTCQGTAGWGAMGASAELQLYWELWASPVSQPQADFALRDRGSGLRVEVSCQASSGSPPVSYSLVGKDGHVLMRQRPDYGRPANFSLPLTQRSDWLRCRAENDISAQSSPLTLVPPGQLPKVPTLVLAASLTSIAAITSGMLVSTVRTRL